MPGEWEGKWTYGPGRTDTYSLKIIKIDGNEVHLTGFFGGGGSGHDDTDVYGRIENSILLLTWPNTTEGQCKDELRIIRDTTNNLILVGQTQCGGWVAKLRLKKIE